MTGLMAVLNELYIRFMVWLGAAPPPGYAHLVHDKAGPREYTLQKGETLFSVARKFGVHYELIARANNIENPESLRLGQVLTIPPADWAPPVDLSAPPKPDLSTLPAAPPETIEKPAVSAPPTEAELPAPASPPTDLPASSKKPEWLKATDLVAPEVDAAIDDLLLKGEPEPFSEELDWQIATAPLGREEAHPAVEPELPPTQPPQVEPAAEVIWPPEEAAPSLETEPVFAPAPAEPETDSEMVFRYEIQRGDTLPAIARRYGATLKELIEANNIVDPSRIFPGQKLIIPGYMTPKPEPQPEVQPIPRPTPPAGQFVYTIASGDTLGGIAKRYGLTIRELIEANQIENPNMLRIGQRLAIPGVAEVAEPRPKPIPRPPVGIDPNFPPLGPMDAVRALYVSYFAIGHPESRQRVFKLLDTTELNAVVIDAKGDHGLISYPTQIPLAHEIGAAHPTAKDFEEILAEFKARGVYLIARLVAFKDNPLTRSYPEFAVKSGDSAEIWQDHEGSSWSDPFLKPVWDYNVQVAIEAAHLGFNEILFDCVRFPTPGQASPPRFSQEVTKELRVAAITGFLSTAHGQLKPAGVKVAASTFGYTCWRKDDTLIGQDIERMGQYLDVLCPVLYPSAFGSGIPGYKFSIAHPYEVVHLSAQRAVERVSPLGCVVRPWIQDFPDYRFDKRVYGRPEIQAQIKGCFEAGSVGFMVWDPRVQYTDGAYAPVNRS